MGKAKGGRGMETLAPMLLILIVTVLAAILLAGQVAEAQRGGGGGRGGGGKPSGSASKPSGSGGSAAGKANADKGLPPGVADSSSPYYNSPRYGVRHGALSNFFLWSWLFHDHDDDEYQEEYIQANTDSGGWLITAIGLVVIVGLAIWIFRRRLGG